MALGTARSRTQLTMLFPHSDYRGLKKRITAIKRAYDAAAGTSQDDGSDPLLLLQRSSTSNESDRSGRPTSPRSVRSSRTASGSNGPLSFPESNLVRQAHNSRQEPAASPVITDEPGETLSDPGHADGEGVKRPPPGPRAATAEQNGFPRMHRRSTTVTGILGRAFSTNYHPQRPNSQKGSAGVEPSGPRFDLRHPIPLMELLPQLTPVERAFFDKLDEELDKVESFYCEREREMRHR
ncbi:hypothetical protein FKP32DRAFT_511020 [Trametes sanguinea]|nr:hypothetical protein FKP32DRAFT_511020 [Trametes sanguinea]